MTVTALPLSRLVWDDGTASQPMAPAAARDFARKLADPDERHLLLARPVAVARASAFK
jgi:hypothetical protein